MILAASGTLAAALLSGLLAPSPDPLAPEASSPCWVEPLRVTLPEIAAMGRIGELVATGHCMRRADASLARHLYHRYVVAQNRIGRFRLFGEELAFGFDVVLEPSRTGGLDNLFAVPAVDLPPAWAMAVDKATYPVPPELAYLLSDPCIGSGVLESIVVDSHRERIDLDFATICSNPSQCVVEAQHPSHAVEEVASVIVGVESNQIRSQKSFQDLPTLREKAKQFE